MVKNPPTMRETWVWSLDWEDPLEEGMSTHSSIVAWEVPMDRGAWRATVHGISKSRTQLCDWAQDTFSEVLSLSLGFLFWLPWRRTMYLRLTLLSTPPYLAHPNILAALPREMECLGLLVGVGDCCQGSLFCPPALATTQLSWREYSYDFSSGVTEQILPAVLARDQRRERRVGSLWEASVFTS